MTISNYQVRADVITALKAEATVTALLTDSDEIREYQWQGTVFGYPAIRVQAETARRPDTDQCNIWNVTITVHCYAESDSSRQCELLANAVDTFFDGKEPLQGTGYRIAKLRSRGKQNARRLSEKVWYSGIPFTGTLAIGG